MPAVVPVLATRMYVFQPSAPPFSPSASTQRLAVRVEPGELCASYQVLELPGHHIARSTMSGTPLSERMRTDTSVLPVLNGLVARRHLFLVHPDVEARVGVHRYCFV